MNDDDPYAPNTAPKLPGHLFTETVRVGDLKVDHTYQRPLSPAWLRRFLPVNGKSPRETYDRRAIGVLSVSWRDNGQGDMYVLDGQHRAKLVEMIEGPDTQVLVAVYANLSLVQEARYFAVLNKDRALRPEERFRSNVAAQDSDALAIVDELARHGYAVTGQPSAGLIVLRFVAGLESILSSAGRPGLRRVATIVKRSWPDDPHATEYAIWSGVWALMQHYHPDVDFDDRLIAKLATHPSLYFTQQAIMTAEGSNAKGVAVARIMRRVYNTRQSPKYRLPEWDGTTTKGKDWITKARPGEEAPA